MGKCPQFNTLFPEQEEMDRVGLFEPTTSAHGFDYFTYPKTGSYGKKETILFKSHPLHIFPFGWSLVCTSKQSFVKNTYEFNQI
jgi:hypothetical protein